MTTRDIQSIRRDFPILGRQVHGVPLIYLDNAATTQKPQSVIDRMNSYYSDENANIHRGVHHLSMVASEAYEGVRSRIANWIGAQDSAEVIFTKGTTEGINFVASSWGEKHVQGADTIVITRMEHHANVVPWQILAQRKKARLQIVELTPEGEIDFESFKRALEHKPKVVAFTMMSNVLGGLNPVAEMAGLAKRAGALVVLDAAQGIAHRRPDLKDIDFMVFSAHKLCGPTGVGVLWGRKSVLETLDPYQQGGGMIGRVSDDLSTWAPLPHRFEAGTPNIAGVLGFGAAIEYLENLGWETIARLERGLTEWAFSRFEELGDSVKLFGPRMREGRAPIFSFELKGVHPHDISQFLDSKGIAVRAGHHCAQPLMRFLGVPATTRASFYFYNTLEEVDALIEGLNQAKEYFK